MEWGAVTKNTGVSECLLTGWQGVVWGESINLKVFIDSKVGGGEC